MVNPKTAVNNIEEAIKELKKIPDLKSYKNSSAKAENDLTSHMLTIVSWFNYLKNNAIGTSEYEMAKEMIENYSDKSGKIFDKQLKEANEKEEQIEIFKDLALSIKEINSIGNIEDIKEYIKQSKENKENLERQVVIVVNRYHYMKNNFPESSLYKEATKMIDELSKEKGLFVGLTDKERKSEKDPKDKTPEKKTDIEQKIDNLLTKIGAYLSRDSINMNKIETYEEEITTLTQELIENSMNLPQEKYKTLLQKLEGSQAYLSNYKEDVISLVNGLDDEGISR